MPSPQQTPETEIIDAEDDDEYEETVRDQMAPMLHCSLISRRCHHSTSTIKNIGMSYYHPAP